MRSLRSAVVLLLCVPAFAQIPPKPAATQAQQGSLTTLRATTTLVLVPAVVHDRNGKPVRGLGMKDFEVLQDGKPQVITSVEEVTQRSPSLAPRTKALEFTNQADASSAPGMLVIVFDRRHTTFANQVFGRDRLLRFLETYQPDGRPLMLLTLEAGGLRIIHDFTEDIESLRAAAKAMRGGAAGRNDATSSTFAQLSTGLEGRSEVLDLNQAVGTFEALRDLASALEGIPGRKALLWANGGIVKINPGYRVDNSFGEDRMTKEFALTLDAFNTANVAVYPIDLRGPVVPNYISAKTQSPKTMRQLIQKTRHGDSNSGGAPGSDRIEDGFNRERTGSMREFAQSTGGVPCIGSNDIENCIHKAMDDSGTYYLLSYRPPASERVVDWHPITVRVKRKGVVVRARAGYAPKGPKAEGDSIDQLRSAIDFPVQQTALPLRVKASKRQDGDKTQVEYDVAIEKIQVAEDDGNRVHLDVNVSAFNAKGERVEATSNTVDGRLNAKGLAQAMSTGLPYAAVISLPAEASLVVFGVRDNLSGRIGTVRAQVAAIRVKP